MTRVAALQFYPLVDDKLLAARSFSFAGKILKQDVPGAQLQWGRDHHILRTTHRVVGSVSMIVQRMCGVRNT